jgi:hypothetical protein
MIELNQAAQCLFCPQRRRIAMLLKIVMAVSTAIIMALILFRPGADRRLRGPGVSRDEGTLKAGVVVAQTPSDPPLSANTSPSMDDPVAMRSAELREQAQARFREVQSELRQLLASSPAQLGEAEKVLERRRKEVLMTKLLVLGEASFSGSGRAEAYKKQVLDILEKEVATLAEQKALLTQLKESK